MPRAEPLWQQRRVFSRRVETSKGRVLVLVHPYYESGDPRYRAVIAKFSRAKMPVVVLEESNKVSSTRSRMASLAPFVVSTMPDDPEPERGWSALHELLKRSGVKRIFLAGVQAKAYDPSTTAEKLSSTRERVVWADKFVYGGDGRNPRGVAMRGCLGWAYAHFKSAGYARISFLPAASWPDRPAPFDAEVLERFRRGHR